MLLISCKPSLEEKAQSVNDKVYGKQSLMASTVVFTLARSYLICILKGHVAPVYVTNNIGITCGEW
jgi:hypothetical protein